MHGMGGGGGAIATDSINQRASLAPRASGISSASAAGQTQSSINSRRRRKQKAGR